MRRPGALHAHAWRQGRLFQCAARLRTILTAGEVFSRYDSTTAQQVAPTLVTFDHSTPEGEKLTALRAALAPIATAGNVIDATRLGYWGTSKGRPAGGGNFGVTGKHDGTTAWRIAAEGAEQNRNGVEMVETPQMEHVTSAIHG
jgi:hypothetical protein